MRTPANLVYESTMPASTNNLIDHHHNIPAILNRCFKRKSNDFDNQPQNKRSVPYTKMYYVHSKKSYTQPQQQQQPIITNNNNQQQQQNRQRIYELPNLNADNVTSSPPMQLQSHHNNSIIEYVTFDNGNNLLPAVQHNSIISEAISLSDLSPSWNNSDLINLDHKENHVQISNGDGCDNNNAQSEDLEDKNLSWLFNFKLDELPHLSPEVKNRNICPTKTQVLITQTNNSNKQIDEKEQLYSNIEVAENVVIENSFVHTPKKPPFTYTELIEYALEDRCELTVSGIYQWISDRFTFYKSNDDRWKNSVRHNLSINPHFRKGNKAPQGAGHLWTISARDSETNLLAWEHKKQRLELFLKLEAANASAAKLNNQSHEEQIIATNDSTMYDETAAATASIALYNDEPNSPLDQQQHQHISLDPLQDDYIYSHHNHSHQHSYQLDQSNSEELRRAADEILNGDVRRNVEVQILNSPSNYNNYHAFALLESGDYLNPISKDEIAQECGLRSSGERNEFGSEFYVTEIDPIELGINMSTHHDDHDELFGDDFNLSYLGLNGSSNIMA